MFEPDGFEGFVTAVVMAQHDGLLLTVPYLTQGNKCSVVAALAEWSAHAIENHSDGLTVQTVHGRTGGTDTDHRYRFAVTPRIEDEQAPNLPMTFRVDLGAQVSDESQTHEDTFNPERFERCVPVRAVGHPMPKYPTENVYILG